MLPASAELLSMFAFGVGDLLGHFFVDGLRLALAGVGLIFALWTVGGSFGIRLARTLGGNLTYFFIMNGARKEVLLRRLSRDRTRFFVIDDVG